VITLVGALSSPVSMAARMRAQNASSIVEITGASISDAFDFRYALDFVVVPPARNAVVTRTSGGHAPSEVLFERALRTSSADRGERYF
jgi:hypothetical protein